MESSIKQLKLSTGEEVICEVLDETPSSIAVRNAYSLIEKFTEDGYKYFSFRAFMVYQDTPLSVMLIMCDNIMAMAIPSLDMLDQYELAKAEMAEYNESLNKTEEEAENDMLDTYLEECQIISLFDSDVSGMLKN